MAIVSIRVRSRFGKLFFALLFAFLCLALLLSAGPITTGRAFCSAAFALLTLLWGKAAFTQKVNL